MEVALVSMERKEILLQRNNKSNTRLGVSLDLKYIKEAFILFNFFSMKCTIYSGRRLQSYLRSSFKL